MAETAVHKSFGEFYRLCGIAPTMELLTNRWKAVTALLDVATLPHLFNLLRFLFDLRTSSDPTLSDLRDRCLAADPSFPSKDADLELKALAAIALLQTIDSHPTFSDPVSLGIISAECKGHRSLAPFALLFERANATIAKRAIAIRTRPRLAIGQLKLSKVLADDLKKVAVEPTAIRDASATAIQELVSGISSVHTLAKSSIELVDKAFDILAEETNILWWVLGEYCPTLGQPISGLPRATAALAIAKELADLTCISPGPRGASSFIGRQLGLTAPPPAATTTLTDAVGSLGLAWREGLKKTAGPSEALLDLTPVLLAIVKSTETDPTPAWHAAFQGATRLTATIAFDFQRLADQLFDELMFHKALAKLQ